MIPIQQVQAFKKALLAQRTDAWLVPSLCDEGYLSLKDEHGAWTVRLLGPTKVEQLVEAEVALFSSCQQIQVFAGSKCLGEGLGCMHPLTLSIHLR